MVDLLVPVPLLDAQKVDGVDRVALDAALALQLVEPAGQVHRGVDVRGVEQLSEILDRRLAATVIVDDRPEKDEQQPRLAGDALHAGRAGEMGLDGADAGHGTISPRCCGGSIFAFSAFHVNAIYAPTCAAASSSSSPPPGIEGLPRRQRPSQLLVAPNGWTLRRPALFRRRRRLHQPGRRPVSLITSRDGTEIFYKDWGKGQPIVFSHGWPLSADDWDAQMLFFLNHGYRVIAHDRRGHGRSAQVGEGHDMDHYADDLAAVTAHLDLKDAVHVGHSTGGGEVVRYLARHGESRVAKAVLISSVPPLMMKTAANPGGLPKEVFDGLQAQLAANRAQFYRDLPAGPFYGFNRPGAKPSEGIIQNWWRQGMMGGTKAHYDGIVAFSQTDFTDDLRKIAVPVLVMHGDDDQIVPYADSGPLSAKLVKNGTLKTYKGFPHGMPTTQAETINTDLLAFLKA
jgi:non-heme chloroperoxidase